MSEDERREAPRFERAHEVLIKVLHSELGGPVDGRIYSCSTADVSVKGVRLHSSVPIAINDQLDLRIRADDRQFVLSGRACWVAKEVEYASGIRFEGAKGDDSQNWLAWVNSL